jgi:hypothetical protein
MQGAMPNLIDFTYRDNVNNNMYSSQCLVHVIEKDEYSGSQHMWSIAEIGEIIASVHISTHMSFTLYCMVCR